MPDAVRSMTGFGAARREGSGVAVQVETRSVNNRHLGVGMRAPSSLESRRSELEAVVRARLVRGSVDVTIQLRRARTAAPGRISTAILDDYVRQLAEAGVPTPPDLVGHLLRLPGVIEDAVPQGVTDEEFAVLREALESALDALVAMREREGAALGADLRAGSAEIERLASLVVKRVPEAVKAAQKRLEERLAALLAETTVAPEIVAREVAVLADRTDVAEETVRLRSHVAQWREALDEGGAIGRRLDFLAQEMAREANTIGSKSQDVDIARAVVDLKVAVERLKEQAANVE